MHLLNQSYFFFCFFFSEKIHYNFSISQFSVKQESSLWQENRTQRNTLPPLPPFCEIFAATFQNIKPYPIF
jgi:hypothetical protein